MRRLAILMMTMCGLLPSKAQQRSLTDSLHYRVEAQASLATGDHAPLWLAANKYGLSSLQTANGYLRGRLERPLQADAHRRWGVGYGVDAALAAGFTSTLVVQQAYVEGRWLKGTLTLGAKEQPVELKNQALSSGAQTLGVNARPVPQLRLALPDYWQVPGLRGWLGLKGHLAYGVTTDDGWQRDFAREGARRTEHTLLHTKAGYLRIGKADKPLTAELGLEMACQFGGRTLNPIDVDAPLLDNDHSAKAFLHALIPGGSDASEDVYRNADGNSLGSIVLRINLDYDAWGLALYGDHFFEDHSSMYMLGWNGFQAEVDDWNTRRSNRMMGYDLKDMLLGLELSLHRTHWLESAVLEYVYTKYQSGPVYHDHTYHIADQISGNDQYYNHGLFTGWQHWGMVMGNPLYLSPLYNDDGEILVKNNRFAAWHLGLSGTPLPALSYRLLATWQRGYGTYDTMYPDPRESVSLLAEASYRLRRGWSVRASLGLDAGKIYGDNAGVQLTVAKCGILTAKRK